MASNKFCIALNIKTGKEFETYGKFFLGTDKKFAQSTFNKLVGDHNITDGHVLQLDLIETRNELPLSVQMLSCNLEQLAENCRIITKEMFKLFNLEEG
jgi:regulatory protein YycH of two-component signal transduction system YycFG